MMRFRGNAVERSIAAKMTQNKRSHCGMSLYPQHGLHPMVRRSLFQRIVLLADLEPSTAASPQCSKVLLAYQVWKDGHALSDAWRTLGQLAVRGCKLSRWSPYGSLAAKLHGVGPVLIS